MSSERRVLWGLMEQRLLDRPSLLPGTTLEQVFAGDLDFPAQIEGDLVSYLGDGGAELFNRLSSTVVRSFYLSGYEPEGHILLTAYLLSAGAISIGDACELLQVDGSNFSLMPESARDLVRLAEILAEEESAGIRKVGDDQTLSDAIEQFYAEWKVRSTDQRDGSAGSESLIV